MRVLIAGSTGVVGRQLVPVLRGAGHDVIGLSRRPGTPADHEVVAVDALDRAAVRVAVKQSRPDAVVHLLTAIPQRLHPRRMAAEFELTNRLRTEGTRNLLDAAHEAGAERMITQGLAFAYRPGPGLAGEDAEFWTDGPAQFQAAVRALVEHEQLTAAHGGLVLRFGHLYGPGTSYAADGTFAADIRRGKVPLAGGGHAVFSFTHTRDAAMAVLAGLDKTVPGALNIVDDDPAPVREWLPVLAERLGGPAPRSAPAWLVRLVAGGWGEAFLNQLRGADNTRARLMLDWRPGFRSWRDGFAGQL